MPFFSYKESHTTFDVLMKKIVLDMLIILNMLIFPKRRYICLAISFLIHKKMINFAQTFS